ncbi:exosome complex component RRP40 [Procambarus clarkii]|uniref:exosome complex component RRP40 n=1 Tax=Procambarus clarkii TaxID=6728 RepID=UPI001E677588|nr:exosome complex component RRP40-like [Procambarus clarkii]
MNPKVGGIEIIGVVLPGDEILKFNPDRNKERIFIGPGLRWEDNVVRATKPGLLKKTPRKLYYVDTHQKRYIPQRREFVIGIVLKKKGDNYAIDIGGSEKATISYLSFENASKKTRKEMKPGDLIYGQLIVANKDMEPELVCIDMYDRAVGMGSLPEDGLMFSIPLHIARSIVDPENPFLLTISRKVKYTIVVGFNGRVWVKAKKQSDMVAIMNCILMLDVMTIQEATENVFRYFESFSKCEPEALMC